MHHPSHTEQLGKLNRVSGQVDGIKRMINQQEYCVDIITQLRAARNALKSIELAILNTHMKSCLHNACHHDETKFNEQIDDIMTLLKKYE